MFGNIKDNEEGFSIVELLITLIIISVAFGAFIVAFTSIQNVNKKALDLAAANVAAFSKVQDYENKGFASLPATAPIGTLQVVEDFSSSLPDSLQSPRVGKVYINTVSSTLKQVVVDITFGSSDSLREIQYADFIQTNGLGQ